ncbi:MAG: hypothetical protein PVH19_00445 [Planctomycetia bacterium]
MTFLVKEGLEIRLFFFFFGGVVDPVRGREAIIWSVAGSFVMVMQKNRPQEPGSVFILGVAFEGPVISSFCFRHSKFDIRRFCPSLFLSIFALKWRHGQEKNSVEIQGKGKNPLF